MTDMPLNAMRAFAAVYQTGGIRQAGRALQITHSAVSRHVRALEAWLGSPLFEDNAARSPLRFTADGHTLGRALVAGFAELDNTVTSIREARNSFSVTLAAPPSFAVRWLLPRLPEFERENPGLDVSVVVDRVRRQPRDSDVDIALTMGRPTDGSGEPLMGDQVFPVVAPAVWNAVRQKNNPAALTSMRLLHDRDPSTAWSKWKHRFGPADLDVRPGARFTSADLVLRAAEQGLGVALARERFARDSLESGTLVRPFGVQALTLRHAYWTTVSERTGSRHTVVRTLAWLHRMAEAR